MDETPSQYQETPNPKSLLELRMESQKGWVLLTSLRYLCLILLSVFLNQSSQGAGVTILTHGFSADVTTWVSSMSDAIYENSSLSDRSVYFVSVTDPGEPDVGPLLVTQNLISGNSPKTSESGEIFILLDWSELSCPDVACSGVERVADYVTPKLLDPSFISEISPGSLADMSLHLIGHSRGAGLVCAIARRLGEHGVLVDHLTTLDPNRYLDQDPVPLVYDNTLFADNYFRNDSQTTPNNGDNLLQDDCEPAPEKSLLDVDGLSVSGSYNRNLSQLDTEVTDQGYNGEHSDVHLWYHGTIDRTQNSYDSCHEINSAMRSSWWSLGEAGGKYTGFYFSRIGSEDWICSGDCRPSGGLHPDIALGSGGTRAPLNYASVNLWPNVSCSHLSNHVWQAGNTIPLKYSFQDLDSPISISIFRDDDSNPLNNSNNPNYRLIPHPNESPIPGEITTSLFNWTPTNLDVGTFFVQVRASDGTHTRYAYFEGQITVNPGLNPPTATNTVPPTGPTPTNTKAPVATITPLGPTPTPGQNTTTVYVYLTDSTGQNAFNETVELDVTGVAGSPFLVTDTDYDVPVPVGWSGTITPRKAGYSFTPASKSFTNVTGYTTQIFKAFPLPGSVTVAIGPQGAKDAGAKWRVLRGSYPESDWLPSGYRKSLSQGDYIIEFWDLDGWITPSDIPITIELNQPGLSRTVSYVQLTGTVSVSLDPPAAISAGAQWNLDNGPWRNSGSPADGVPEGIHTVRFSSVAGWLTPQDRSVTVTANETSLVYQSYDEESPDPVITSITPPSGPLVGGSQLTILGRKFAAPVGSVTFGEKHAPLVTWVSPNELRVRTPANERSGPVNVVVEAANGQAESENGFTYTSQRGENLEVIGQLGGSVRAVAVQGQHAIIGEGPNLVVLDVSSPNSPQEAGRVLLDGLVYDIALSPGNKAFVSAGDAGLYVIDYSDPAHPLVLGLYDTPKDTRSLDLVGGNLYLSDFDDLYIFDVLSNPASPVILGATTGIGTTYDLDVAVTTSGLMAFLAVGGTIQIFDVSDPTSPQRVLSHDVSPGASRSIAVSGNELHVGYEATPYQVFEIQNPIGLDLKGSSSQFYVSSITIENGLAYLSALGGLRILSLDFDPDISVLGFLGGFTLFSKAVKAGDFVYVADPEKGLACVDVSNPASPSQVGLYEPKISYVARVAILQDHAYLSGQNGGNIATVDISNPQVPTKTGGYTVGGGGGVSGLDIEGTNLYIATNIGGEIASLSNPQIPSLLGTFPLSGVPLWAIKARASRAYVHRQNMNVIPNTSMLEVFSITNPSAPSSLGFLDFGKTIATSSFSLHEDIVVLPDSNSPDLRLVAIGNPDEVQVVGSAVIPAQRSQSVDTDGDYAYLAADRQGLLIYDISNPASPSFTSSYDTDGVAYDVKFQNDFALINDVFAGVKLVDVQDPANPSLWGYYNTPGSSFTTQSLEIAENTIYLADGEGGLLILGIKDVEEPLVSITNPIFVGSGMTGLRNASNPTLNLGGVSSDDRGVSKVTWFNDRGGEGNALGTENWTASGIDLYVGENSLRVFAEDAAGNIGSVTLVVSLTAPIPTPTATCAPIDPVIAVAKSIPSNVGEGQTVTLDGTESTGPITNYFWSQLSGEPLVELSDEYGPVTTFSAPFVDSETVLEFLLTVSSDDPCSSGPIAEASTAIVVLPPPTMTPTASFTETNSPTPSSTNTATRTPTPTITQTPTPSETPTVSQTPTPSFTESPTVTQTPTPSFTESPTETLPLTPTLTPVGPLTLLELLDPNAEDITAMELFDFALRWKR